MMNEANEIFNKANDLLDKSQFDSAIKLYEESLMLSPEPDAVGNLMIAYSLRHVNFSARLLKEFPDSIIAYIHRITMELKYGQAEKAFKLCTKAMSTLTLSDNSISQLSALRLKSAIKAGIADYFRQDFVEVWQSLSSFKSRQKLLQDMLNVNHSTFSSAFFHLANDDIYTKSVRHLFEKKAELLEQLSAIDENDFT